MMAGVIPALVKGGHLDAARSIIEQELAIARSSGDLRGRARSLGSAARFFARMGEEVRACGMAREVLEIRVKLGDDRQVALAFLVVGEVLVAQGKGTPAARLWGAAEQIFDGLEDERPPIDRNATKELRDKLVLSLEASDLDREIEAGRNLGSDEAVRLAEAFLVSAIPSRV